MNVCDIPQLINNIESAASAVLTTTTTTTITNNENLCKKNDMENLKVNPKKRWLKCSSMEQPKLEIIENNTNLDYFRAVSNIDSMCCVASPLSDYSDSSSMYNNLIKNYFEKKNNL